MKSNSFAKPSSVCGSITSPVILWALRERVFPVSLCASAHQTPLALVARLAKLFDERHFFWIAFWSIRRLRAISPRWLVGFDRVNPFATFSWALPIAFGVELERAVFHSKAVTVQVEVVPQPSSPMNGLWGISSLINSSQGTSVSHVFIYRTSRLAWC